MSHLESLDVLAGRMQRQSRFEPVACSVTRGSRRSHVDLLEVLTHSVTLYSSRSHVTSSEVLTDRK